MEKYGWKIIEWVKERITEAISDIVMWFYLWLGIAIAMKIFFNL